MRLAAGVFQRSQIDDMYNHHVYFHYLYSCIKANRVLYSNLNSRIHRKRDRLIPYFTPRILDKVTNNNALHHYKRHYCYTIVISTKPANLNFQIQNIILNIKYHTFNTKSTFNRATIIIHLSSNYSYKQKLNLIIS